MVNRIDENWQEKYNTMRIFYEDRLKHLDELLEKSMEMNAKLVGMLQDRRADEKHFGVGE